MGRMPEAVHQKQKRRQKAARHKKTHGFACVYPAEIDRKNARMRQHVGVFTVNFSSNLAKLLRTEKERVLCRAEARRRRHTGCLSRQRNDGAARNAPFAAYVFLCQAA